MVKTDNGVEMYNILNGNMIWNWKIGSTDEFIDWKFNFCKMVLTEIVCGILWLTLGDTSYHLLLLDTLTGQEIFNDSSWSDMEWIYCEDGDQGPSDAFPLLAASDNYVVACRRPNEVVHENVQRSFLCIRVDAQQKNMQGQED